MNRTIPYLTACAVFAVTGAAWTQAQQKEVPDPTPPPLGTASFVPPPKTEQQPLTSESFVVDAAVASMTEIEIGTMAIEKSATPEVKQLAREMVADHKAALGKLKDVAAAAKIALPGTLDIDRQKQKDELARHSGPAFDQKFVDSVKQAHHETVALFEAAEKSSELTPALREYAASSLPTLREHERMAQQIEAAGR